jgi:hypothetical protein
MAVSKPARPEHRFPARRVRASSAASDRTPDFVVHPDGGLGLVTQALGRRPSAKAALVACREGSERSVKILSQREAEADRDQLTIPEGWGFVGRVPTCGRAPAEPLNRDAAGAMDEHTPP